MPKYIASLDYLLDFPSIIGKPESEEHALKALAGIEHLQGLGRLLQAFALLDADEVSPELLEDHLENLAAGVATVGELMRIIGDSAYTEVELLTEAHQKKGMVNLHRRKQ